MTNILFNGGTGAQILPTEQDRWRDITSAPRDGTVIEIQNNWGVAPSFGIYKWVDATGWVNARDDNFGVGDGAHLSWRPFEGEASDYVDPTKGAQDTREYWLAACRRRGVDC